MYPTPYFELNQVLGELVSRMQAILCSDLVGAYLQGSFVVGDFDRHSDVDYIVVVLNELSSSQVAALQGMHDRVFHQESKWAQHLEGSYFPQDVLRNHAKRGAKLWYLDNGASALVQSDHCNTLLVRWVVREKGIVLAGPPPSTLIDPISEESLRMEMYETITNWGQEILSNPAPYNNWFYQTFIVLNYCRMLHDLHSGVAGSKRQGANWAKATLDPAWSRLIDAAWDGRPSPEQKIRLPANPQDFIQTLKFVEFIIDESRLYMTNR